MTAAYDIATKITDNAEECILIVDDSKAQRRLLASTLQRTGYHVLEASSAEEGLEIVTRDESISIIVSDWGMPGMDGPDFCQALRALDREYLYFILITSRSDQQERSTGLDAGADDFVTRPVNWQELRARIRAGERILNLQRQMREKSEIAETALCELQGIHTAVQADLIEARKLQQSLIPPPVQIFEGSNVASKLITCGQIGGDLIGTFPIGEDRLALYSIDVSGHGIASALMTGRLSGLFSSQSPERNIAFSKWIDGQTHLDRPHMVVDRLNKLMLSELDTDIYFTCVLVYYTPSTGWIELCQAGHPHPILLSANGNTKLIGRGGPPVGLVDGLSYECIDFQMRPGDRLFLYSDGLSESLNQSGEMLGEDGLAKLFQKHGALSNAEALTCVEQDVQTFINHRGLEDDISMLSLEANAR